MKIAIKSFKQLYHIGALNQSLSTPRAVSLEGHCLSVSEVPEAWRTIARLGAQPVWQLTKAGNKFLNVSKSSKKLRSLINHWALQAGFAATAVGCQTEMEGEYDTCFALSINEEEAISTWGEANEDGVLSHRSVPILVATQALIDYVRQPLELLLVPDMLLLAYADQVLGLDGVFWNETLDVYALSAPRAGIYPQKLSEWTINPVLP
jgi:hypothetical protein